MAGEGRTPNGESGRSDLWTSAPLAPWARALILGAAAVLGVLDLAALRGSDSSIADVLIIIAVYVALALVAVRVTIGAVALLVAMAASVPTGLWLPAGVIGLALSGVVVGKTTLRFAAGYLTGAVLWLVVVLVLLDDARAVAFVPVTVLTASVSVGVAYAAVSRRSAAAEARISGFEQERARSVAEERNRIARELHDIVAHHVTMASMHANVVSMSRDAEQRERSLHVIADSTRQALTELRWMLRLLQSSDDVAEPGEESLRLEATIAAVREHLRGLGLSMEVEHDSEALADLPLDLDVALGRILQEAATNVVKHADPARTVVLRTARDEEQVRLELRNGVGSSLGLASSGMGLGNMSARAGEHGGTVTGTQVGDTWVLRCAVPIP